MRKQSTVIILENKRRVNSSNNSNNSSNNSNNNNDNSVINKTNEYLGLLTAPNPLEKPSIRKVSNLIPVEEMKNILGPSLNQKKMIPRRTTAAVLANEKAKNIAQNINPFQGLKISASKANNLVDVILTEDHRWTNVPDNYQDYKAEDFIMKLDTTKLETLLESMNAMEFSEEIISDIEDKQPEETADEIITEAIRMRERDKLIILDIYEKFRKYRKAQQKQFHTLLKCIREESGYDKTEARLQERDLQLARLERMVTQKNKFIDIIHKLGARPSSDQIRSALENNVQEDIQVLVSTLEDYQADIDERVSKRKKLLSEVVRSRSTLVQKFQFSKVEEEQLASLSKKEFELRTKLELIDEDLSKVRTTNAKTNETILAMDLKAASKEQALTSNNSTEEHQEMEELRNMISEVNEQREKDLVKIQELEKSISEISSSPLVQMEEESDEDHEDEASEFTPNGDQVSRRKSSVSQYSNNNINNINNPNNFNGNNSNYNGSINKNDIQNSTPDYSRLASISAKLDISDYTRQMEEIINYSLEVSLTKALLPTEAYKAPKEVVETPKQLQLKREVLEAFERTKLRTRDPNNTLLEENEEGEDEDNYKPTIEVEGYGLNLVLNQATKLLGIISLEGDKDVNEKVQRKRKQAEVFLINDITELLNTKEEKKKNSFDDDDSDDDDGSDSDDSQKSSHSYEYGTAIYENRKQLSEAIQRRRVKLQELREIGKKLDKTLSNAYEKLKNEKKNRMDIFKTIMKNIAGDQKRNLPHLLFQSDIDAQKLLDKKNSLLREQLRWQRRMEDLIKKPEKVPIMSKSKKPQTKNRITQQQQQRQKQESKKESNQESNTPKTITPMSEGSAQLDDDDYDDDEKEAMLLENLNTGTEYLVADEEEKMKSQSNIDALNENEINQSDENNLSDENSLIPEIDQSSTAIAPDPHFLFQEELNKPSHYTIVQNGYSQDLMNLQIDNTKDGVNVKYEPETKKNQRIENMVNDKKKSSVIYSLGDFHEFIHVSKIDDHSKRKQSERVKIKQSEHPNQRKETKSEIINLMEYSLQGTKIDLQDQSRDIYTSNRTRLNAQDLNSGSSLIDGEYSSEYSMRSQVTQSTNQVVDDLIQKLETGIPFSAPHFMRSSREKISSRSQSYSRSFSTTPIQIKSPISMTQLTSRESNITNLIHDLDDDDLDDNDNNNYDNTELENLDQNKHQKYQERRNYYHNKYTHEYQHNNENKSYHNRHELIRLIQFNPPRIWRGSHSSPTIINILNELSESFPTASPLIGNFHSKKLTISKTQQSNLSSSVQNTTIGIFQRPEELQNDNTNEKSPNKKTLESFGNEESEPSAVDLFSQSIVTKHLIGRSTWDRVVGMHSEFAKNFIASRLKDTKLVFIVNTADSRESTANSSSLQHPTNISTIESTASFEELVKSYSTEIDNNGISSNSVWSMNPLPIVRIPTSQQLNQLPVQEDNIEENSPIDLTSSSQQLMDLKAHEPTTPKPSFSPRKKSQNRKVNPSVLIPLT